MRIKDRVLELLVQNSGKYMSGEEIAKSLSVSRTAVWKAVNDLRAEGIEIDAVTNRGYCLSKGTDLLTASGIRSNLPENLKDIDLYVFKTVDSTNTVLKQKAAEGASEGTVVISAQQTASRGRLGRSFFSPSDSGLYISILIRPKAEASEAVNVTTAAAVAVCEAIEAVTEKKASIKWVNDIWIENRKVCGILTEAAFNMENGKIDYAVMGAGVNVYTPDGGFPEELKGIASSICGESKASGLRNILAAEIISRFLEYSKDLSGKSYIDKYREKCFVVGKRVTVVSGDKKEEALVLGIDDGFKLLVRYDDGREDRLSSGEISIRL